MSTNNIFYMLLNSNCLLLLEAPKFVEKLENIEVNVGKTAIIDCVCSGEPEPDCDWFFEEKPIKDEGRYARILVANNLKLFLFTPVLNVS